MNFNTNRNNQTYGRTTSAVLVGNLRNTAASTTRKFKFCNRNSPDLNVTFNCVFNGLYNKPVINNYFENSFTTFHILNGEVPTDKLRSKSINGPFSPQQIKNAYSISNIIPLPGIRRPIVTIITAFNNPYLRSDVNKFGNIFGLPSCDLQIYNFSRSFSANWAVETTLDVQWVYAINPYAKIRVIQATSNQWNHIFSAINFANTKINTDIITMSFGSRDNGGLSYYNNYFTNKNTIYLAASGDNSVVCFPSACSNVIAVGGTTLNLNANLSRFSEIVWSYSGCGFSKSFAKPSYQPLLESKNKKVTPDVCCVANPNTPCYMVIKGKLYSVGGTSLSSPIYAGMFSLLTQKRLNNNQTTYTSVINNANSIQPLLYDPANSSCFYDITQGSSGGNNATIGFDAASGLGVLKSDNINTNLG